MGFDIVERIMLENEEYPELDRIAWLDYEFYVAYLNEMSNAAKEEMGLYITIGLLAGQASAKADHAKRLPDYFKPYYEVSGVV